MFHKNDNPLNKVLAQQTGINEQYLHDLENDVHSDSGKSIQRGLYFHIFRLQRYLINFRNNQQPALTLGYIQEAVKTSEGVQELHNLHTGYLLIKYKLKPMKNVIDWNEATRKQFESEGCMIEARIDALLGDNGDKIPYSRFMPAK